MSAIIVAAGACVLVASATGKGTAQQAQTPVRGGTLVVSLAGDPGTLNPDLNTYSTHAVEIARNIFDTLVAYNSKWQTIPDLARTWKVSPDAKTVTFHLAKNVKWSDGTPFTSADVKWTYGAIKTQKGWAIDYLSNVRSIQTPDKYTVVLKLSHPDASLVSTLADQGLSILPAHLYKGTDWNKNPANLKPVGTGPYIFDSYTPDAQVVLKANPKYFQGGPYLDKLVFQVTPDQATALAALQSGQVQFTTNFAPPGTVPSLQKNKNVRVDFYTYPVIAYQAYNLNRKPLNNPLVRKALAYAVDRNAINRIAQNGLTTTANHLYLEGAWATSKGVVLPKYNPTLANRLLDQAGFKRDKDGNRFSLEYLIYTGYGVEPVADVVKEQLKKVGIKLNIDALEWGSYVTKGTDRKDFDVMFGMGFTGPDPSLIGPFVKSGGFSNVSGYSNATVNHLLQKAVATPNEATRARYYRQIQQILLRDMPRLPLFDRKVPFPVAANCHNFWTDSNPEAWKQQGERSYWKVWCSK
jgi:peptide/nickel transport system substrate-binding protein